MFDMNETLIVVYKDEMLVNQFKKLVESNNDEERTPLNVVSWTEKVWLGNKKAGNIKGKILFLDDIKGTDKLIPVIDIAFDKYGVRYGWAGNQAVVYATSKLPEKYDEFIGELSELPIPETYKKRVRDEELENEEIVKADVENAKETQKYDDEYDCEENDKVAGLLKFAKRAIAVSADIIEKASDKAVDIAEDMIDRRDVKKQKMFYGIAKFYSDGLEDFLRK